MQISNAYAQTAGAAGSMGGLMEFLPIILMFGVLYFLMIRPQMKKAKEHKALVAALAKGDEVVTQAGIAGRIAKVGDDFISVEIAEKVEVQIQKSAVALFLSKSNMKNL